MSDSDFGRRLAGGCLAAALSLTAGCGGRQSSNVLDPANELPFGAVDVPAADAQVKAQTPIAGWALDDRGVKEVRVYVDGHLASHGPLTEQRPDVSKAFPQYARAGDRHGWVLTMAFAAPGPHSVIVQAVDTDGATRDIGTFKLTTLER